MINYDVFVLQMATLRDLQLLTNESIRAGKDSEEAKKLAEDYFIEMCESNDIPEKNRMEIELTPKEVDGKVLYALRVTNSNELFQKLSPADKVRVIQYQQQMTSR